MSPLLLPGGRHSSSDAAPVDTATDNILLGARLTQWSPASGRTIQSSGLRDTGGIYLVSVHRAQTGNVHRAVSNDFVLNTGDILYFTGFVESFGEFCEEHGMEIVTNEVETDPTIPVSPSVPTPTAEEEVDQSISCSTNEEEVPHLLNLQNIGLATVEEDDDALFSGVPIEVGATKESLLQADGVERIRCINRLTDLIRGIKKMSREEMRSTKQLSNSRIVVTIDKDLVVVGINAQDRQGLLVDIAKVLLRFNLQLRHTEAAVRNKRSLSIWRCEAGDTELLDEEEIW